MISRLLPGTLLVMLALVGCGKQSASPSAAAKPSSAGGRPWLLALRAQDKVTVAGVLSSETDRANAAQAFAARLAPPPTPMSNLLRSSEGESTAGLSATLNALPDLASAAQADADHAVVVVSRCDGKWSDVMPLAKTTDAAIVQALGDAAPDASLIEAATKSFRESYAAAQESARVASLPEPVIVLVISKDRLEAHGALADENDKRRLLVALASKYVSKTLNEHVTVNSGVKPAADFAKTLADAPKGDAEAVVVLKHSSKPQVLEAKAGDELIKKLGDAGVAKSVADAVAASVKK